MRILGLETKDDCGRIVATMASDGRKIAIEIEIASTTATDHIDLTKLARAVASHLNHPDQLEETERLAEVGRKHIEAEEHQLRKEKLLEKLDKSVDELELPVMTGNALSNGNIYHIGELIALTEEELVKRVKSVLPNQTFGKKSVRFVNSVLDVMGLSLGMKAEVERLGWTPEGAERRNIQRDSDHVP